MDTAQTYRCIRWLSSMYHNGRKNFNLLQTYSKIHPHISQSQWNQATSNNFLSYTTQYPNNQYNKNTCICGNSILTTCLYLSRNQHVLQEWNSSRISMIKLAHAQTTAAGNNSTHKQDNTTDTTAMVSYNCHFHICHSIHYTIWPLMWTLEQANC